MEKAEQKSILVKKSEAARMLGFGIRWLEGQLNNGAPCVRVGRSVRLRRSDVEAFARDGKWPGDVEKHMGWVLARSRGEAMNGSHRGQRLFASREEAESGIKPGTALRAFQIAIAAPTE